MVKPKSKMLTKIVTAMLCMLLLTCMFAVPASAATIKNGSYYLNLYGYEGESLYNRPVGLYHSGRGKDQQFTTHRHEGKMVIVNTQNYDYALNRHSGNGTCITYPLSGGLKDSMLSSWGSRIELTKYRGMPLMAQGQYQYAVCTWGGTSGYAKWTWKR